jgi:hypothetical protein
MAKGVIPTRLGALLAVKGEGTATALLLRETPLICWSSLSCRVSFHPA